MKATGIVRRIDDLGRVVVPKEIRRTMRIREGQAMEIYTGREGEIILKKYSPIEELAECAAGFTKSISTVTGCLVCVSDQEQIVAANGLGTEKLSWQVHQQPAGGSDSEPENSTCASR
ncbi:MAG: AbrB/MazE/SpoVT family DNA-binding domain-containing protein [Lachnospiraceae bacterium]